MRSSPAFPLLAVRRSAVAGSPWARGRLLSWSGIILCCLILGVAAIARMEHVHARHAALLALPADDVPLHPSLVNLARAEAGPLFAARCASCHGIDMAGDTASGAPNLRDGNWLFGTGRVFDIERTILYGVRVGERSRNVAEMPAYGQTGLLTPAQIRRVVSYLQRLNGRTIDAGAAAEGRAVYLGRGGCADCHGGDAAGNADYGAPNLTTNSFAHGGSAQALYDSIYFGRHSMMPGFRGTLRLEQIRALAVSIHAASHPQTAPSGAPAGSAP